MPVKSAHWAFTTNADGTTDHFLLAPDGVRSNAPVVSNDSAGDSVLVSLNKTYSAGFISGVGAPGVFPTAADGGAGSLTGTYYYAVTYYTTGGETDVNTTVPTPITVTARQVSLTGIPVSSNSDVIGRHIWRNTAANGTVNDFRKYQLVGSIANNTQTTYTDNVADGSLGRTIPSISTTKGSVRFSNSVVANMLGITTKFGEAALASDTGYASVAIGYYALNANTTGIRNTGVGVYALAKNTTGDENTAIGVHALDFNLTGRGATAGGFGALQSYTGTTSTNPPTAWGYKAMSAATTPAQGNTALGTYTLTVMTTADFNTAVGGSALRNTTSSQNCAVGFQAGTANTSGSGHTLIGYTAGAAVTTGNFLTAVGFEASRLATGSGLTSLGYGAGKAVTTGSSSVHIGFLSGAYDSAGNSFYLDALNRTDITGGKANSLMYGIFASTPSAQLLHINAPVKHLVTTVAGLPAATIGAGFRAIVTDASAPTFGATVAGGGAVTVPVYSDGAAWKVG